MIHPVPKPKKPRKPAVQVFPDGREVCNLNFKRGREEYQRRKLAMYIRQRQMCAICGIYLFVTGWDFDHEDGRGMGGGHRDDRIEKDGKRYNAAVCSVCNMLKGSQRIPYRYQ